MAQRCVFAKRKRDFGLAQVFSQSRSPVPVVVSASSSVSSSPFAPLSASSSHQASSRQNGKYIIDYVPVSHEDDGQDPARKGTDSDVEMRDVSHYGWDQGPLQSQPQLAGPSRSFSSPNSMYPTLLVKDSPLPSLLLNQSIQAAPHQRDRDRDYDPLDIIIVEYSSSLLPPPPRRSPRKTKK
ncbi:hypothetical protein H4582DRAFT_1958293 [Lactarius indigo]|nr:hypothetical protein H4582DRAFT_1958293 [Lactarius indigo]